MSISSISSANLLLPSMHSGDNHTSHNTVYWGQQLSSVNNINQDLIQAQTKNPSYSALPAAMLKSVTTIGNTLENSQITSLSAHKNMQDNAYIKKYLP